jgi:hypothetical protein
VSKVDDDQLAALRRLRAAFGFVEVVEIASSDQDDPAATQAERAEAGQVRIVNPRRMTHKQSARTGRTPLASSNKGTMMVGA